MRAYAQYAQGRSRTLVFVPSVQMGQAVADRFVRAGYRADLIHGGLPLAERRALRAQFREGSLPILVNCQVFTEGLDEPATDCLILARPTLSKTLYLQMLGRGTRHAPGKTDCLVLDCVGATQAHDLQTVAALFDQRPEELAGRSVRQVLETPRTSRPMPPPDAALDAIPVDLFARRPAHWLLVASDLAVLSLGPAGTLLVQRRHTDLWILQHLQGPTQIRTLHVGTDLEALLATGEAYARTQPCPSALLDPRASWRRDPATPSQLRRIAALAIPVPPSLTKGEASDQIARAHAFHVLATPSA